MKASIVIGLALIAGCSSPMVRCDRDLTRINSPQNLFSDPVGTLQAPSRLAPSHDPGKTPEKSGPGKASSGQKAAKPGAIPPPKPGDAP